MKMTNNLEGDVLLFNAAPAGEMNFVNGQPDMTQGFDSALYLCLFGGNVLDDGLENNKNTWWANYNIDQSHKRYVSRLQNLIRGLPLVTGNLRRIEEAAKADLQGFIVEKIAAKVEASATIPQLNFCELVISITSQEGEISETRFMLNWQSYL